MKKTSKYIVACLAIMIIGVGISMRNDAKATEKDEELIEESLTVGNVASVNGTPNDGAIVTDADGNVVEGSDNDYVFVEEDDDYFDDNGKVTTTGRSEEDDKKVTTTGKDKDQVLVSGTTTTVTTTTAPLVTTTTYNPSVTTAPADDDIFYNEDNSNIANSDDFDYEAALEEVLALTKDSTSCYSEGVDCSLAGYGNNCDGKGCTGEDVWD